MSFDNLMKSVGQRNNLGELDFRDNRYVLTIDGRMEVGCFQANGRFYIHGVITALPTGIKDKEELLRNMMQKNLGLSISQRVVLSIEPDGQHLALHYSRSLQGLNEEIIEDALSEFTNNFEYYLNLASTERMSLASVPTMIMP